MTGPILRALSEHDWHGRQPLCYMLPARPGVTQSGDEHDKLETDLAFDHFREMDPWHRSSRSVIVRGEEK